jgi:hypothetical protein
MRSTFRGVGVISRALGMPGSPSQTVNTLYGLGGTNPIAIIHHALPAVDAAEQGIMANLPTPQHGE